MKFNLVTDLWRPSQVKKEVEIENKQNEFILTCVKGRLDYIEKKDVLYSLMIEYLGTYEKEFDYNSITEKIQDRENEVKELKFIRSLLDKQMIIKLGDGINEEIRV